MSPDHFNVEVRPVGEPVAEAGWYLAFGYGIKPMVVYATRGMTVWRVGMRRIPITRYAGPIPELR
ncbi:hypothetical protein [Stenotrophomonas maltophilia]|uniref:hypothetical protein n=1 Tax=Stenotrophomonas maltophilia TaxID=40324 RepID=UPI0021C8C9F9|nr:hypothetical protein [Stenotrophomonas maltophilia]MCU1133254.1 hypothetical protein [Stenotrophomonas maltophilia]